MLTGAGHLAFITALSGAGIVGARFRVGGGLYGQVFPVEAGYPRMGDSDTANDGRGENVLTWKFVVPRGTDWGPTPADEAEMVDANGVALYESKLTPPFRTSALHTCTLFINIYLRRL